MDSNEVRALARYCGFELAGVAKAEPVPEREWYTEWVSAGFAGEMRYLADRRADLRNDPRNLLASARSIICVGRLYNTPYPYSTRFSEEDRGWISRYAWGDDYHDEMRRGLERLDSILRERAGVGYQSKICIDTAPLLERSYARMAGLGWIGKNTCLINQQSGSWFFLGELLVSLEMAPDAPPPERCGTCTRCIDACPTEAIVPAGSRHAIDSQRCISYFTIELRGPIPQEMHVGIGAHVFGCDICQDVCPWNRRAPTTAEPAYQPRHYAPRLEDMAAITEDEFQAMFARTPVSRARYEGFQRNVAIAMTNRASFRHRHPYTKMNGDDAPVVLGRS
jgi:epoxyqueuosine reductase